MTRHLMTFSVRDTEQDNDIFEHKRYLARPGLASTAALVPRVRRWARQFYPRVKLDE